MRIGCHHRHPSHHTHCRQVLHERLRVLHESRRHDDAPTDAEVEIDRIERRAQQGG